jgi:hypothetical protein
MGSTLGATVQNFATTVINNHKLFITFHPRACTIFTVVIHTTLLSTSASFTASCLYPSPIFVDKVRAYTRITKDCNRSFASLFISHTKRFNASWRKRLAQKYTLEIELRFCHPNHPCKRLPAHIFFIRVGCEHSSDNLINVSLKKMTWSCFTPLPPEKSQWR